MPDEDTFDSKESSTVPDEDTDGSLGGKAASILGELGGSDLTVASSTAAISSIEVCIQRDQEVDCNI